MDRTKAKRVETEDDLEDAEAAGATAGAGATDKGGRQRKLKTIRK